MTTYYRDARVRVTSSEVWVDGRDYQLADLEYVWHRRGTVSARAFSRKAARVVLVFAVAVLAVIWFAKTPALIAMSRGLPSLWIRIALVLAGSLAVLAVGWVLLELVLSGLDHVHVHGVAVHEIWARSRDQDILLLRTADALLFGRVYRAMERALEQHPG